MKNYVTICALVFATFFAQHLYAASINGPRSDAMEQNCTHASPIKRLECERLKEEIARREKDRVDCIYALADMERFIRQNDNHPVHKSEHYKNKTRGETDMGHKLGLVYEYSKWLFRKPISGKEQWLKAENEAKNKLKTAKWADIDSVNWEFCKKSKYFEVLDSGKFIPPAR